MKLRLFILCTSLSFLVNISLNAQARLFLDVPSLYAHTSDVKNIKSNVGAGLDFAFVLASHHLFSRTSLGATALVALNSDDIAKSINFTPFVKQEVGAGIYRSNGNKCSLHDSNAFTSVAKVGIIYPFVKDASYDILVGVDLGYFRIRDWFKNNEIVLDAGYLTRAKTIYVNFGYKMFLNLRGRD